MSNEQPCVHVPNVGAVAVPSSWTKEYPVAQSAHYKPPSWYVRQFVTFEATIVQFDLLAVRVYPYWQMPQS
jgi:hypothetical protein